MAFSIFLGAVLMMQHFMATDAEVKAEIQQQRGEGATKTSAGITEEP